MHSQPDSDKALPYEEVIHQADYHQAAGDYIARHYGTEVALTFPLAVESLINSLLVNNPESVAQQIIGGLFGLYPI
jgi:hypothetical protein